ncbi:MAG: DNA polymerase III subunit delta', partial [bacterium]|nr:DNA polymerase III subunit delta' [bacterium]
MKSQWEFFVKTAKTGSLSHAYLLSGNDAQKKTEAVSKLIQFLYCEHPGVLISCGKCRSCNAVSKGLHPDITKISKDGSEIKIIQILRLNSFLSLTSSQGKVKTIVIEEADCMNAQAQSAFLKLLEEPKGDTLFLLLTEYPALLLPTIHSR